MAFHDIDLQRIKNKVGGFCSKLSPAHLKDQLRFEYGVEKQNVIIYEVRPVWNNPAEHTKAPLAKLDFNNSKKIWTLYWHRANGKWVKYEPRESDNDLDVLLREIENDVYGCFFG